MTGVMLVRQRVASIEQWNAVFRNPALDAKRREHGLVVMDMDNQSVARQFAASDELAAARKRAGAIGPPDGVWLGTQQVGES